VFVAADDTAKMDFLKTKKKDTLIPIQQQREVEINLKAKGVMIKGPSRKVADAAKDLESLLESLIVVESQFPSKKRQKDLLRRKIVEYLKVSQSSQYHCALPSKEAMETAVSFTCIYLGPEIRNEVDKDIQTILAENNEGPPLFLFFFFFFLFSSLFHARAGN